MKTVTEIWLEALTEEQAKELLSHLIVCLNECDEDDMFGTEGWRHQFELEEEIP